MTTLELIRQAVEKYTDIDPALVVPEAELAALDIDSMTFAEMLFDIEDKLGKELPNFGRPHTVAALIAIIDSAA